MSSTGFRVGRWSAFRVRANLQECDFLIFVHSVLYGSRIVAAAVHCPHVHLEVQQGPCVRATLRCSCCQQVLWRTGSGNQVVWCTVGDCMQTWGSPAAGFLVCHSTRCLINRAGLGRSCQQTVSPEGIRRHWTTWTPLCSNALKCIGVWLGVT